MTAKFPVPAGFRAVGWTQVEPGQAIWYIKDNPRPMGPWIVVDGSARLIRPLNGTVHRKLNLDEILVRPDAPPPKPG
ncbi:MAG: hypothetical protein HY816_22960 [Candidatus Wallbacteria bacterium]|nr:hypothetical protein [Candidatus Wallbacteria bacterium]